MIALSDEWTGNAPITVCVGRYSTQLWLGDRVLRHALDAIKDSHTCDLLVFFSDLSAFQRFARNQSEEQLFSVLTECYELVGDIATGGGGKVVKFIGDATLLVFPADWVDDGVLAQRSILRHCCLPPVWR